MADKAQANGHEASVKPEFVVNLRGKEFVLYAGVLDLAHQKGIRRLETEVVQLPSDQNGRECVVRATLELEGGRIFTDYGDANPTNVNRPIAQHLIRMASTRAKARVLRDATNIGLTALEELGSLEDDEPASPPLPRAAQAEGARPSREPRGTRGGADSPRGIAVTDAQLRAIRSIARSKGMTPQAVEDFARRQFNAPLESLNIDEASHIIKELQRV
ncbi:MAG TPA: hypothetical protein VF406_19215 [Thermodesulfobacteriota bacterium]